MTTDLTRRDAFDHWTPVTLRFSDQDSLGHVNNVAYAAFVAAGNNDVGARLAQTFGDGAA